jgi:hypothetical protein
MQKGDKGALAKFLDRFVEKDARIMSDDDSAIAKAAKAFSGGHDTVTHSKHVYARDKVVHANSVEGLASQLKRVQMGVFHHISKKHLQRYVDEIVFRRNQRFMRLRKREDHFDERYVFEYDLVYRDFQNQLADLLKRAVGRQIRRSQVGGLEWPPPIAPGYAAAPSAPKS